MQNRHKMTMRTPATDWRDGLPCGNGAMCASVYGNITPETVLFNHDALWYEGKRSGVPDISDRLADCRQAALSGDFAKANATMAPALTQRGFTGSLPILHPAFDLKVRCRQHEAFRAYERTLDFTTGEAAVCWQDGKTAAYQRKFFVSMADDVAVMEVDAEFSDLDIAFQLCEHDLYDSAQMDGVPKAPPLQFETAVYGDKLVLKVRGSQGGDYGAVLRLIAQDSRVDFLEETDWTEQLSSLPMLWGLPLPRRHTATVRGGRRALVMVGMYVNVDDAEEAIDQTIHRLDALPCDYAALFARHAAIHRERFLRCELALDGIEEAPENNETLLLDAYAGRASLGLVQRLFDMGRYLLMACSTGNCMPPTLQGTWNGDYYPPWNSFYVHNENTQMFYWQALCGATPELLEAMFTYFERFLDDYRENARKLFGCRGIFIALTAAADTGLIQDAQPHVLHFIGVAAWVAQHFYDRYLFTGDEAFLRGRALPFIREVALFYQDYLLRDARGQVLIVPSNSPENAPLEGNDKNADYSRTMNPGVPLTINATVDVALVREIFTNLLSACEVLGVDDPEMPAWRDILEHLPAFRVNGDGALAEWIHPAHQDNYAHRHLSHIYPFFPGFQITREDHPALCDAVRVAMEKRLTVGLEAQTGWSLVHQANIYARMGEPDKVTACLDLLAQTCVGANLFTYHNDYRNMGSTLHIILGRGAPYQIDANMGFTSAIFESLVFSTPRLIRIMPAVSADWRRGKLGKVCCRNCVTLSLCWDQDAGRIEVHLETARAGAFTLSLPAGYALSALPDGWAETAPGTYQAEGAPGQVFMLTAERMKL